MDEMAAYYPPPPPPPGSVHYPYYHHQPPQPPTPVAPPPPPQHHHHHHLVHQPYYPPQTQPYAPYAPPLVAQAAYDEVRTLFVAGLPEDVKPREIYNLFREFPGYESSHLRTPTEKTQPFAFAVFLDQQSAIGAMQALNGMVFDLEKGSTLYIDLAKSNSRSKRSRTDDERSGSDKKARGSSYSRATSDPGVGSIHMPGMGNSAYNMIGYPSAPSGKVKGFSNSSCWTPCSMNLDHGSFSGSGVNEPIASNMNSSSAQHFPQNNTPCPTLFVANLGPTCTEQELVQVFSRCPGFIKLKMQSTYGAPVAFVDFQDTASSTGALGHLQGTILYSSTSGEGMRLEFAKSRMGMRKKPK